MSWILDLIIVMIAVFTVLVAFKKGFIRIFISTVSFAVALIATLFVWMNYTNRPILLVCVFIGSLIVLEIIASVLDLVCKIPVLKQANKILGILLGVVLAFVRVMIFVWMINILIDNTQIFSVDVLNKIDRNNTYIFKQLSEINFFEFLK